MTENDLMSYLVPLEEQSGCYDYKIHGLCVYSLTRDNLRYRYFRHKGIAFNTRPDKTKYWDTVKTFFISLFHILKIVILRPNVDYIFHAFARLEAINGEYIDKFSDPIIDSIGLNSYAIFQYGRGGVHLTPRRHSKNVYYTDFLKIWLSVVKPLTYLWYSLFYRNALRGLFDSLHKVYVDMPIDKKEIVFDFHSNYAYYRLYKLLLKIMKPKAIMGTCRDQLYALFIAANKLGIKHCEFQHGITIGETGLYSGYRYNPLLPDVFLAFGENNPKTVYGVDESRIRNIGWALYDYLKDVVYDEKITEKDVLVVSDPEITGKLLEVVLALAQEAPDLVFHFRPHPLEKLTNDQLKMIQSTDNVKLQNKNVNITLVLSKFNLVIGENSTVLYEALSMNKKVGRLCMNGLTPQWLNDEDSSYFWQINDEKDFVEFVKADSSERKSKSIYSPFNKKIFLSVVENG